MEFFSRLCHIKQQLARCERWSISILKFPHNVHNMLSSLSVHISKRSSVHWRKSETKNGTNISFQWGCQDPFLVAVDGLVHKPEGNKPIYKPTTCGVPLWAQALLCSGKPKCMLMVSKQLHPRSPNICFIFKEDSSEISILDSHYHPTTRRDW